MLNRGWSGCPLWSPQPCGCLQTHQGKEQQEFCTSWVTGAKLFHTLFHLPRGVRPQSFLIHNFFSKLVLQCKENVLLFLNFRLCLSDSFPLNLWSLLPVLCRRFSLYTSFSTLSMLCVPPVIAGFSQRVFPEDNGEGIMVLLILNMGFLQCFVCYP